ncbi:MAG TPA: hypothetical protein VKB35_06285, partial [Ktedonobacteraceae bacterium]|nr:hypothetical protein [Ktedonobacteraceae bacterium]
YIRSLHVRNTTDPERYVLLYEDELTYYRRAVVNRGWAGQGQPMAIKLKQGAQYNSVRRIAGCLDVSTGQLISRQRSTSPGKANGSLLPLCRAALSPSGTNLSSPG